MKSMIGKLIATAIMVVAMLLSSSAEAQTGQYRVLTKTPETLRQHGATQNRPPFRHWRHVRRFYHRHNHHKHRCTYCIRYEKWKNWKPLRYDPVLHVCR